MFAFLVYLLPIWNPSANLQPFPLLKTKLHSRLKTRIQPSFIMAKLGMADGGHRSEKPSIIVHDDEFNINYKKFLLIKMKCPKSGNAKEEIQTLN